MTICGGQRDAPGGHYTKDKPSTRRGAVHSIGWLCLTRAATIRGEQGGSCAIVLWRPLAFACGAPPTADMRVDAVLL
jgi:hypothetical protein